MFRLLSILALIATAVLVILQLMRGSSSAADEASPVHPRGRKAQGLIYIAMLIGTFVGAITGIGSVIITGKTIAGWTLILHCLAAPLFAIGIAAVALMWAGRYMEGGRAAGAVVFWLMLISGMVTILSIGLTMTPMFGVEDQHFLLDVHRYSSLALVVFMALHAARLVAVSRAQQPARADATTPATRAATPERAGA
jgi:hypothetical protein